MTGDAAERANERVAAYILEQFHDKPGDGETAEHLAVCDSARVTNPDASNGTYGCDTGCDYTRFTATIACDHDRQIDFEYGEFGRLGDILIGL